LWGGVRLGPNRRTKVRTEFGYMKPSLGAEWHVETTVESRGSERHASNRNFAGLVNYEPLSAEQVDGCAAPRYNVMMF